MAARPAPNTIQVMHSIISRTPLAVRIVPLAARELPGLTFKNTRFWVQCADGQPLEPHDVFQTEHPTNCRGPQLTLQDRSVDPADPLSIFSLDLTTEHFDPGEIAFLTRLHDTLLRQDMPAAS